MMAWQSDGFLHSLSMVVSTRWWITAWFLITAPVVFWDAGYCFMRYVLRIRSMILINKFQAKVNEGSYKPCYWARALDYPPFIFRAVISIGSGARTRFIRRYVCAHSHHATDLQAMSLNYVFWLRFLQIDYVSLWSLLCLSPSWQCFQVYGLPALESNDGFTNAQCTPFLVSSSVTCLMLSSSFHEYCRDYSQHHICLSYTQYSMAWCSTLRVWCRSHDTFQNTSVLAQRILLWILSNWSQRYVNVDHLLDPTQWVSLLLLPGLGIYHHQPSISRLWIIVPSMIVWVLGKSIIQSLAVASDSPKVHSKKVM